METSPCRIAPSCRMSFTGIYIRSIQVSEGVTMPRAAGLLLVLLALLALQAACRAEEGDGRSPSRWRDSSLAILGRLLGSEPLASLWARDRRGPPPGPPPASPPDPALPLRGPSAPCLSPVPAPAFPVTPPNWMVWRTDEVPPVPRGLYEAVQENVQRFWQIQHALDRGGWGMPPWFAGAPMPPPCGGGPVATPAPRRPPNVPPCPPSVPVPDQPGVGGDEGPGTPQAAAPPTEEQGGGQVGSQDGDQGGQGMQDGQVGEGVQGGQGGDGIQDGEGVRDVQQGRGSEPPATPLQPDLLAVLPVVPPASVPDSVAALLPSGGSVSDGFIPMTDIPVVVVDADGLFDMPAETERPPADESEAPGTEAPVPGATEEANTASNEVAST